MPLFDYQALDQAGKRTKGVLEAENERTARTKLRELKLFPLEIKSGSPAGARSVGRPGHSTKELASAMRQMAFLVGAGLPVVEALSAVVDQSGPTKMGRIMGQVKDEVVGGRSLAEAFANFPQVFPPIMVNMVRAGEAAGALEVVLDRLAELLESRVRLLTRVRAALAYPVFIILAGGVVLVFLFSYVVPTVTGIFAETGQLLPLPTRILIAVSGATKSYGWLGGIILAGLVLGYLALSRTKAGRRALDRFKLKTPFLGRLNQRVVLARFTKTMATLLGSGVNVVDSLGITARVTGNLVYQESLEEARKRIEQGGRLAGELANSPLFPPLVSHLVAAGERSAQLDKVFDRLAQGYEEEVETGLAGLLALMEPFLILIMGGVVGFIVISILLPIFDMTSLVR